MSGKGRKMVWKLLLIGCSFVATGARATVLPADEEEVILSSLEALRIGECILMWEGEGARGAVRALNERFILTAVVSRGGLEAFLKETKPPDVATAIVMKVKRSSAVENLLLENSKRLFWFVWFLISGDELRPEIRIPFNCQFFRVEKGSGRNLALVESYHLKNSSTFSKRFAEWTPEKGFQTQELNMYRRRTDFQGIELEITVCNKFQVENEVKMFWLQSARILNFSVKMVEVNLSNTADGSACLWGITGLDLEREWIFLEFGVRVKLGSMFRSSNDVGWRAYVRPFKKDMWTAVGVWLLLSTAAIVAVNGWNKRTLYLNVYTGFFCLCNSDPMVVHPPGEPVPSRTKLVHLMALAAPAVLVPAYSAYVLSTLSIVLPLDPFPDLRAFIADGTHRLTAVHNTFGIRYLRGSNDPLIKHINDHLFVGSHQAPPDFDTMFRQLCDDSKLVGLVPYTAEIRTLFRCRMSFMPQELTTISTGVLLPKGSPLRKLFNERFSEYHERGTFVAKRPWGVHPSSAEENDNFRSLNMSQMGTIFLLIPFGVVLSLVVLATEIYLKKLFPKGGEKNDTKFYTLQRFLHQHSPNAGPSLLHV